MPEKLQLPHTNDADIMRMAIAWAIVERATIADNTSGSENRAELLLKLYQKAYAGLNGPPGPAKP